MEYLGNIFKLQADFAKMNKPIMTVAPGHVFNSAAGLFAASGFPSVCHTTKVAFNECTFGFVPHAGSSYYTSRLPGDFGTFLALTGLPITGKDALKLGMAETMILQPETYDEEISDVMMAFDSPHLPTGKEVRGAQVPGCQYR